MERCSPLAKSGMGLPGPGFELSACGCLRGSPAGRQGRGVFAYIFLALTWILTSQKERGLGAALTSVSSPSTAVASCPLPLHSYTSCHLCVPCSRKGESSLLNSLLNKPLKLQVAVLNPEYPKTDLSAGTSNFSLPNGLPSQLGSGSHWSPTQQPFLHPPWGLNAAFVQVAMLAEPREMQCQCQPITVILFHFASEWSRQLLANEL